MWSSLGFVGHGVVGAGTRRGTSVKCEAAKAQNPIGVHALVFIGDLTESNVRKAAEGASKAGYDVLELPMMERDMDTEMIKRVLSEHGLQSSGSMGLTFDTDVSSTDPATVERGEELLNDALTNTAKLGSTFLGGAIFSALGKYDAPVTKEGLQNSVSVLKRLAKRANSLGVTLGLEPCNRFETNMINTVEDACRVIDMIGEPSVVVHADTYHMNIEEDDMAQAFRTFKDHIGYVHVGSSHRGYLGSGSVDFRSVFQALSDSEYSGVITFESFSAKVVHPTLSQALAIWKEKWTDSADVALKAREFIRKEMAATYGSN